MAELADDPDTPLFFGRLDFGVGNPDHEGARYHVGRRHVTDELGEPLVLDSRAPISRTFYQASVKDPQGVRTRRRFGFVRGDLTSFEDEHLQAGTAIRTSRILLAEIERPRVRPMRDIVATIQPEQDELVRAALEDSICVRGAPGTGNPDPRNGHTAATGLGNRNVLFADDLEGAPGAMERPRTACVETVDRQLPK